MREQQIALVAFTAVGAQTAGRLAQALGRDGYAAEAWAMPRHAAEGVCPLDASLGDWTGWAFSHCGGIVFVGAAGVAVRAIAPFVRDKLHDPAVVVLDERAQFVIPLLSGHLGGANELAVRIAHLMGAQPVITTATDLNGRFAVDLFARRQNLAIRERAVAKEISAALLDGKTVGLCSDFVIEGELPEGIVMAEEGALGICISLSGEEELFGRTLHLIPRIVTLGVGCRRGVETEVFAQAVDGMLSQAGLAPEAICRVATIDRKAQEPCITAFCEGRGLPLFTASAEVLAAMQGGFSASEFVRETVGVDNVCERAATLVSGGTLLMRKHRQNGVTAAAAAEPLRLRLTEEDEGTEESI